jgi:hypothetical protein
MITAILNSFSSPFVGGIANIVDLNRTLKKMIESLQYYTDQIRLNSLPIE